MSGIAVVIPCYNAARTLTEALDSLAVQTRPPDEIVLVDDGSSDDSAAIAARYPHVEVILHRRNRGIAAATNTGVAWTAAELVALLDADDVWLPNHLETVAGLLDAHPTAGWAFSASQAFGSRTVAEIGRVWGHLMPCHGPTDLWTACFDSIIVPGSTGIVRRDVLAAVGGLGEAKALRVAPDYDLWLRLALEAPAAWAPEVTVRYRQHAGQMSFQKPLGQWEAVYASRFAVAAEAQHRQDARAEAIAERLRQRFVRDYGKVRWARDHRRETILQALWSHVEMRRILRCGDPSWFPLVEAEMFEEETARIHAAYTARGMFQPR